MHPDVAAAKAAIELKLGGRKPTVGIVLGTGLGLFADRIENPIRIPYANIPGFKTAAVTGHAGQLVVGTMSDTPVAALQGRIHIYEGYTAAEVAFPIRVLDAIGVKVLLVTCAAGGINSQHRPGSLMMIEDHINFMGANPLIGHPHHDNGSVRFLDMTQAYSSRLREKMNDAAERLKIDLRPGVYLAVSGPNYETPSEVKAFGWLGADAVGMSVVPEVLVARQVGLEVAGLALITNWAAGISGRRLTHEDVLQTARAAMDSLSKLFEEFIGSL
jgi:purine-nucleoside phosphorylase